MRNSKNIFSFSILLFSILCGSGFICAQPFIVGDTSSPLITYVNIKDTIVLEEYNIDIDFDNINDIHFCFDQWTYSPANYGYSYTVGQSNALLPFKIQFVCIGTSSDADTLPPGSQLDKTLNWNNNLQTVYLYYYDVWWIPPPGTVYTHGICYNHTNLYIGFRKIISTDTLYGWFFFDFYQGLKIRSYAIDRLINTNITDHPKEKNNLIIYPNPADNFIEILDGSNSLKDFDLIINNLNGQELLKTKIEFVDKYKIDIKQFPTGIYIVNLQNSEEQIVKKIAIYRE